MGWVVVVARDVECSALQVVQRLVGWGIGGAAGIVDRAPGVAQGAESGTEPVARNPGLRGDSCSREAQELSGPDREVGGTGEIRVARAGLGLDKSSGQRFYGWRIDERSSR